DTPGGVAVLVARCVSPAPASFVGRCRRHRAVDAPGGAAPSSGPFGAGGRGAAGVRWRGPGPPSSGRSGHAWRRGGVGGPVRLAGPRSEEHTSELQSRENLVCRLLLEKKKKRGAMARGGPELLARGCA